MSLAAANFLQVTSPSYIIFTDATALQKKIGVDADKDYITLYIIKEMSTKEIVFAVRRKQGEGQPWELHYCFTFLRDKSSEKTTVSESESPS